MLRSRLAPVILTLTLLTSPSLAAQSVLERTPNLAGTWVGAPNTLHFNFLHRFDASDGPVRNVDNSPTFLLGYSFRGYGLLGVQYATASTLVPAHPNEWEVLARFSPLSSELGAAFALGLTAAFNEAAESFDSELALGVPLGPVKLMGSMRHFTNAYAEGGSRWAFGGGARLKLGDHVALSGDIITPTGKREGEEAGWGAALQLAIPYTPHTVSLQMTNTNSATLQGSSLKSSDTRFGFEFTIPVTLDRYFGGGGVTTAEGPRVGTATLQAGDTLRISITDFEFSQPNVTVPVGTYVLWVNEGEVLHTTTAESGLWSSLMMAPGESYGRVFTEVGEYAYHCTPHPFMEATITVQGARSPR